MAGAQFVRCLLTEMEFRLAFGAAVKDTRAEF